MNFGLVGIALRPRNRPLSPLIPIHWILLRTNRAMSAPSKRPADDGAEVPAKKPRTTSEARPAPTGPPASRTVLHWFRVDLRTADNSALHAASERARALGDANLVGLYVVSPAEWAKHDIAPVRIDLWMRTLELLKEDLQSKFGVPLVVARAEKRRDVPELVAKLANDLNAAEVTWNIEYEVNELARDAATKKLLEAKGVKVTEKHDQCVVQPGLVRTKESKIYTVFTPFKNSWIRHVAADTAKTLALSPNPEANRFPFSKSHTTIFDSHFSVPEASDITPELHAELAGSDEAKLRLSRIRSLFPAGEPAAQDRLHAKFLAKHIKQYHVERNLPEHSATPDLFAGSSRLSPYLSCGSLSARQCVAAARTANNGKLEGGSEGIAVWISEIVWRDFYRNILVAFPRVCKNKAFKEETEKVAWSYDEEKFKMWCEGRTGFPIVDAGMRQLKKDGWMHNRLRMIVAMFLTKDLLIDWRLGERYFMKNLIDGDFASNNGGWQWAASTGTDAQPYFRVFNPLLQSQKCDPSGVFIRAYVPELAAMKGKAIHEPDSEARRKAGYPKEMVKHEEARIKAIDAFKKAAGKS
ncbi:deoxyribodipyrimidine photo-lyase [Hyaloraphidium curvatum]|nr:deoxyribodipyrimidine photo-lyase [Hyaloraphidium curvatum]